MGKFIVCLLKHIYFMCMYVYLSITYVQDPEWAKGGHSFPRARVIDACMLPSEPKSSIYKSIKLS